MADPIVDRYINRDGNRDGKNQPADPGRDPLVPVEHGCLVSLPGSVAAMLDLRFKDRRRRAIPYAYITGVEIEPGDQITLATNEKTVTLTGRNLESVYQAIITHTAAAVAEPRSGFDQGGQAPFIERIEVVEASDQTG